MGSEGTETLSSLTRDSSVDDESRPAVASLDPRLAWGLLFVGAGLTLAMRASGWEQVFVGNAIDLLPADSQYHARRALYTFSSFPKVLLYDHYINYPGGASVPWPPLFDFVVGGVASLFARDQYGFEIVAACAGPAFAVLTTVPIYLTAVRLDGRGVGVGAVAFFALLPISINYSRLGNADHHSAVCMIGAWLLYVCIRLVDPRQEPRSLRALGDGLVVVRLALLLTWHGSLLYLVLAEATLLLAAALQGRRSLLAVQSLSALATAAVLVPLLASMPTPLFGDYSSIALSRLHLIAMLAVAATAGGVWLLEGVRPARGPLGRLGRMAICAAGFVAIVLALPGPRAGLEPAFLFLTMGDGVGVATQEQTPLFAYFSRTPVRPATIAWGGYAYLIPLLPLAAAARAWQTADGRRSGALVLMLWASFFGLLAMTQRRYGNDLAPAASVLFPLALFWIGRTLAQLVSPAGLQRSVAVSIAAALGLALFLPSILGPAGQLSRAAASLAAARGDEASLHDGWMRQASTLARFARQVRAATPRTLGYLSSDAVPEYGIIANSNLGHALQYGARRATATDPFWAYIGPENWNRTKAFLSAETEKEALKQAKELRGRYVVTVEGGVGGSVVRRLHRYDGLSAEELPAFAHFRLVVEAERGGRAIGEKFRPRHQRRSVPYKLFEIVEGARLDVALAPGTEVVASLSVRTNNRRTFVYEARAIADLDGAASLRLPYATDGRGPVRAPAPYDLRAGGREWQVHVPEHAVIQGDVVGE